MMYLGDQAVGIATLKELNGFFEVVHRFTPTENESRHTMPNFGAGIYIVCEDPILTLSKYKNEFSQYGNYPLVAVPFTVRKNTNGTYYVHQCVSLVLTGNNNAFYDYWGSHIRINDNSSLTFGTADSNGGVGNFMANHNYVVFKTISNEGGDT